MLVQRLGFGVVTFGVVKRRQAVQRLRDIGVIRTERLLSYLQRPPVQRLGFYIATLALVKYRQVVERFCNTRVIGSERLFPDRQRALSKRKRFGKTTLFIKLSDLLI